MLLLLSFTLFFLADTVANLRRLILHDALCVFSQVFGSCVCSGVVRLEVLSFRVCHSPEDAVLGRQITHVTAFLRTIEECKEAEET